MENPAYEVSRIVTFKSTNATGNVYFTEFLTWQGECRENFLLDYAPEALEDLKGNTRLFTSSCSCEYFYELRPFDEVTIRMFEGKARQNVLELWFEYRRGTQIIAKGRQELAWFHEAQDGLVPCPIPESLFRGIRQARRDFERSK